MILFFQSIRNGFLDVIMNGFSFFGEMAVPLIAIVIIYWCIDKRKGFIITASLMTALLTTQIVKAIVRYPRPFMAYPELVDAGRLSTATGYSFPSGHSTASSSLYSALYACFRSKAMLIIAIILIIMVPVSRLYLGVHWPMDVAAGTVIGLLSTLLFTRISTDILRDEHAYRKYALIYGIAALAASIVFTAVLLLPDADERAFADLAGNAAIAAGAMLGFSCESRYAGFSNSGRMGRKILSAAAGILGLCFIMLLLGMLPFPHAVKSSVLMFSAGFWVSFIYPLIAVHAGLMERA